MKDFIIPSGVKVLYEDEKYGRFSFAPLERGYGVTIGNSLRRVLLSSIEGAAVYAVRFRVSYRKEPESLMTRTEEVLHEFTALKGVFEDIPRIILNIKKLRFKFPEEIGEKEAIGRVKKMGPAVITGKDIELPEFVDCLTPDLHIAEITGEGTELEIEFRINRGRGYVQVEDMKVDLPEGFILVDAIYSPVQKVNFTVENIRVGAKTDYEKVVIDIWTDGSIKPYKALTKAATILQEHFQRFFNIEEEKEEDRDRVRFEERERIRAFILQDISILELSKRTLNCLRDAGITKVYQLVAMNEEDLLKLKNFGQKSLSEVKEKLGRFNYSLGMDVSKYLKEEDLRNETP